MPEKTKNELLFEKAQRSIRELWEDMTVSQQDTWYNLSALRDEILELMNLLEVED